MRSLSSTLLDNQAIAPLAWPAVKVEIKNNRGAVRHLQFAKAYEGSEFQYLHAAACAGDGSLIRARIWRDPADGKRYIHRSRVASPGLASDFTSWTLVEECSYGGVTVAAYSDGELGVVANVSILYWGPDFYQLREIKSTDYGVTWSAPATVHTMSNACYHPAAAMNHHGDMLLVWFEWDTVYAMRCVAGVWQAHDTCPFKPDICSGIAVCYHDDYHIVFTGRNDAGEACIWMIQYGDGVEVTQGVWGSEMVWCAREDALQKDFYCPSLTYLNEFRLTFEEVYEVWPLVYTYYSTHSIPGKSFMADLWREPVPLEIVPGDDWSGQYPGPAISHNDDNVFLSTCNQVWIAPRALVTANVTNDVVAIKNTITPGLYRSKLQVTLDNTANVYNDFAKLGYEMTLSLGYQTEAGPEYQTQPSHWITGWKMVSPGWFPLRAIFPPGVIGTVTIEAQDLWDILAQWVAQYDVDWTVGQKSIREMIEYILARCGFELVELSHSDGIDSYHPAFSILAGQSGKLAMKKLLSYVEDVLIQREEKVYLKMPARADASDYEYNSTFFTAHLVYRGQYGQSAWIPNRVQVWGTNFVVDDFEFSQINPLTDRLARISKPSYATAAEGLHRVEKEMRHGEIWHGSGGWAQVPVNCGQEVFDVITITDTTAGVTAITRRVIGITTTYNKMKNSYLQKLLLGMP